jgi:hypothetical protein
VPIRIFIILLGLLGSTFVAFGQDAVSELPANLAVPEGNIAFLDITGDGVQIYRCEENSEAAGTFHWVFVEPQADLVNETDERLGIHYAGPSWEANDGSIVRGEVLERADSPEDGTIPWLLLRAISVSGNGLFSHVTFIQRLDTAGGVVLVPESCTEALSGSLYRVPYQALYRFYTADPVDMNPPNVAANLQVPDGNAVSYQTHAEGVQIYRCQESAETAGTFAWTFVGPQADLLSEVDKRIGLHYSGPTWESADGSWIVGEVVERADSPDGAIPWLLLHTKSAQGGGILGDIQFIQRIDTVGGVAPAADSCTADQNQQIARIPYSALYVFYSAT